MIVSRFLEKSISVILLQYEKALFLIVVTLLGIVSLPDNEVQLLNAYAPIDVTFPKSSDLIPVAFWKELLPIVVPSSLPLIVIEVILLSSAKA